MSTEAVLHFDKTVKKVEFFPFAWDSNLLAVCLKDSISVYLYKDASNDTDVVLQATEFDTVEIGNSKVSRNLELLFTEKFPEKAIIDFSWNPSTNLHSIKPTINYAFCQSGALTFCESNFLSFGDANSRANRSGQGSSFPVADTVHKIAFDKHKGEHLAYLAENSCYLWNCSENKLRAKFSLQSSGVNVCFHAEEQTKVMVAEKSGHIRIYNVLSLKPIYTLMCFNSHFNPLESFPVLSHDWSQQSPEIVIANTATDIVLWNTASSCLPEKILENGDKLRSIEISKYKENIIGYASGNDVNSKLIVFNYKTKQTIYQSRPMKLLNSFSFNTLLPIVATANENKISIINLIN